MNNQELLSIAEAHGSTLYVYDASKIKSQYQRLYTAFSSIKQLKVNLCCSCTFQYFYFDISEKPRKWIGYGITPRSSVRSSCRIPERIIFTPNGVSMDEIEAVVAIGAQINIDNLATLEEFGNRHPEVPVCIRINPHVMAG